MASASRRRHGGAVNSWHAAWAGKQVRAGARHATQARAQTRARRTQHGREGHRRCCTLAGAMTSSTPSGVRADVSGDHNHDAESSHRCSPSSPAVLCRARAVIRAHATTTSSSSSTAPRATAATLSPSVTTEWRVAPLEKANDAMDNAARSRHPDGEEHGGERARRSV